jgi:peptide/nickel transport system substrate-binding protein
MMGAATPGRRRFLRSLLALGVWPLAPGRAGADPATLTIGQPADADSLDPHRTSSVLAAERLYNLYDTLVNLDFDLNTISRGLAESWQVSPDGHTYTFKLKRGVRFHGGKPLTAQDVKFSLDRWRDPATAAPTRHRIAGVDEISAPDDGTVVLRLRRPSNYLLFHLASPFASILNPDALKRHGTYYGTQAVDGTGPFRFREWILRDRFVADRNPEYTWGPPIFHNPGPARIERVVWRLLREGDGRPFEDTGIDATRWMAQPEAVRLAAHPRLRVARYKVGYTVFLSFNLARPPVQDRRVRRAINHAVNKDEIIREVFGGLGVPAFGPLAPIVPGALKDARAGYEHNPERARSLLDEAGWKPGPDGVRVRDGKALRLPVMAIGAYGYPQVLALLRSQLYPVGVVVEPVLVEESAIWNHLRSGDHTVFAMGMPHSNADELLGFYFDSRQRATPNPADLIDPRIHQLLDEGRTAGAAKRRDEIYAEIQQRVIESAAWVPLWHPERVMVTTSRVRGLRPHPIYDVGYHKLLDVSLEPAS